LLSLWNSITILAFIVAHNVTSTAFVNVCVYIPGAKVLVCKGLGIGNSTRLSDRLDKTTAYKIPGSRTLYNINVNTQMKFENFYYKI
jgi:hypothetical protein